MIIRPATSRKRPLILGSLVAAASVVLLAFPALAQADPGVTSGGSTTANVDVASAITLTSLTESFTLSGIPAEIVTTGATPVTMTVWTNNTQGYTVTVQAATGSLVGAIPGNTDVIPIADLQVTNSVGDLTDMSAATPVTVNAKTGPSLETGDNLSNGYSMTIPFVAQDTYSGTLNYIAATV